MHKKTILGGFDDFVTGASDLLGTKKPSFLFPIIKRLAIGLLAGEQAKTPSPKDMKLRAAFHPVLARLAPTFMEYRQVFESKNALLGIDEPDVPNLLPKRSVIWCANHGFKDDITASVAAASTRNAYILLGSLPAFFNTLDGIGALINGVILCNRKVKKSRMLATQAGKQILQMGTDLIFFPEGVWNKTPERLLIDLWPGIYRIAVETHAPVVPVIHYLADPHQKYPGNVIHTLIGEPIDLEKYSEEDGLRHLRDTMATWYYLMMERYGKTTREQLLSGFRNADEYWEAYLKIHTGQIAYYDQEIELSADYIPKRRILPEQVWAPVAEIKTITPQNAAQVAQAVRTIELEKRRNVQRRF